MLREDGYYWVRVAPSDHWDEWQVAWTLDKEIWYVPGKFQYPVTTDKILEIGEQIIRNKNK